MDPRPAAPVKMSTKRLERLSEVIIDALKLLSTQQQKLTPESLSEALRGRQDFWQTLPGNGKESADSAVTTQNEPPLPASSSAPVTIVGSDPGAVSGAPWPAQDDVPGLSEFYRKSILALLTLVQETENQNLATSLDHMRSLILSNSTDLETLDRSLQQIKNLIIKEALDTPSSKSQRSSSFWSFWQRRSKPERKPEGSPGEPDFEFQRLQHLLLAIINELQLGLGNEYHQRFRDLKARFESSRDVTTLLEPTEELIGMIQGYMRDLTQQRNEVASFVKELGAGLLEMESQLVTSLTHSEETYEFNEAFNRSLTGQLDDIRESFSISRSLEEARSFVLSKLRAIKSALESKRKQDESNLQHAHEKMGNLQKGFERMKKEIGQVHKKTRILEQEILLDSLTGIYNRRAYEMRIKEELSRFQRYNQPFSLILFDIDHFKKINDQFGHQAGDKCLREITARIRPSLRHCDFLARYGGEEFTIILPGTIEEDAHRVAEKVRNLIERTRFLYQGAEVPVTISVGLTQALPTDQDAEALFKRVDTAMYQAKKEGRNQTRRG